MVADHESRLLWPDTQKRHLDILLSIGTAYSDPRSQSSNLRTLKPFPEVRPWFEFLKKRFHKNLDAEQVWEDFRHAVVPSSSSVARRYVRFNPKLVTVVPHMDETSEKDLFRDNVGIRLRSPAMKALAEKIARRLLASSFHFDKVTVQRGSNDYITIQGLCAGSQS